MAAKTGQPASNQAPKGILRQINPASSKGGFKEVVLPVIVILVIILAGTATGYFLANKGTGLSGLGSKVGSGVKLGGGPKEAGMKDESLFPDKAEGKIKINDNEDVTEGSHQLLRPGGVSQTAYLTSSTLDLSEFIDQCVEVWGETFSAQKAGWFMDVGYVRKLDSCPEGL